MDPITFEESLKGPSVDVSLRLLSRRFNYAFRRTRDLDVAMSAVNELLDRTLSYREFLALLRH